MLIVQSSFFYCHGSAYRGLPVCLLPYWQTYRPSLCWFHFRGNLSVVCCKGTDTEIHQSISF